jgi:molybdenum cofactor cytidylyltransferase
MPQIDSTAGIILAAGRSVRFGRTKQLLEINGKPLLAHVLEAARGSQLDPLVLVLGHEHHKIRMALEAYLNQPRLRVIINVRYREGQSRSLQAGLRALPRYCPAVMFLPADQPLLKPATIDCLLEHFQHSGKDICVPVYNGQYRSPAIFSRAMFDQLLAVEGDVGGREVIRANPGRVLAVEMLDPSDFVDIDCEKDLEDLQKMAASVHRAG